MGMFGEFEIATCNRAAEALRPEQSQQAADAGGQAIPVTCAAHLHCLAASPRQREGAANGLHGQQRITLSDGITPSRLPTLLALSWQEARRRVAPVRGVTVAANQGAAWRSV
jgi:hypothetical protein